MHGMIFAELKKYVDAKVGGNAWNKLLADAGLGPRIYLALQAYPDEEVVKIVTAASAATGLPQERLHELWQNALRMLSTTPPKGPQRSRTLSRMPSVREGNSGGDGDRSARTGSRPRIERSLKYGI